VFDELKRRDTTEPVLAHPILTDPFELEVDASGFAMGAVLLQKKEDGKKHPIAYYSKTLSVTVWTGKTPDSAVMTTRARKYH
jgi:hypothetical protein